MPIAPGTRLGVYEVVSLLGEGGMGQVYRARDPRLGREVAVKVIATDAALDGDRLRRFEQEAHAAAALQHPNVVAVYDVGTHEGTPYIVEELLDGTTLRERLSDGALPPKKAIDIATGIARGLAAAHERRIVHRDLKPENIFLTRDGRAKILDFGLAKLAAAGPGAQGVSQMATAEGLTAAGTILGTVGYMSPEQIRGEATDHRTDIFSFGVVLYEMLTGRRPFTGRTAADIMTAVLREDVPSMTTEGRAPIAPSLERIVGYCLEKDPGHRLQSAHDLAIALEATSGVDSSVSGTTNATGAASARSSRWRLLIAAALVAGIALVSYLAGRTSTAPAVLPTFQRVTYQKGSVSGARFGAEPSSVIYAANWGGSPLHLYTARVGSPESSAFGPRGLALASVATTGELAVLRDAGPHPANPLALVGTLGRMPPAGGAPRDVLEGVESADWSPDGGNLAVVRTVDGRSRLEYPIGTVLFESAGWMDRIRVSPDGSRIAFGEHPLLGDDRGWLTIVEVGTKNVRRLTDERGSMRGVAWSRTGSEIFFGTGTRIEAVSLQGDARVVSTGTGTPVVLDASGDGSLLVDYGDFSVEARLLTADGDERDVTWLDGTIPMGFWPDGRRLLFWEGFRYGAYYRDVDGSPAVRLGEGTPMSLSHDATRVLAVQHTEPMRLAVYPTGAGESRIVPTGRVEGIAWGQWTLDDRIVFAGEEPGQGSRLYLTSTDSREPTPLGPPGLTLVRYAGDVVTPDGRFVVAAAAEDTFVLVPLAGGGDVQRVGGMRAGDQPLAWEPDGRTLLVREHGTASTMTLVQIDVTTGRRASWKTVTPRDGSTNFGSQVVTISRDRQSIAYNLNWSRSTLFTVRVQPAD